MIQYRHLAAFDLSSYGTALALINRYVDDNDIKVFEISPCGQGALLILVAREINSLQLVLSESQILFRAAILNSVVIENIHESLLSVYLSQNKVSLGAALVMFEGNSLAESLVLADRLLKNEFKLVDFRIIRTFPINALLAVACDNCETVQKIETSSFKVTYIEAVQNSLRSYFEIG